MKTTTMFLAMVVVASQAFGAGTTVWWENPDDGDWSRPERWIVDTGSHRVPNGGDAVYINGATVAVTSQPASAHDLWIGRDDRDSIPQTSSSDMPLGKSGRVRVSYPASYPSYALGVAGELNLDGPGSTGSELVISSGRVYAGNNLQVGIAADSSGIVRMIPDPNHPDDPPALDIYRDMAFGLPGAGCMVQTCGTAVVQCGLLELGDFSADEASTGAFGRYFLSGGAGLSIDVQQVYNDSGLAMGHSEGSWGECRISQQSRMLLHGAGSNERGAGNYMWHDKGVVVGGGPSALPPGGVGFLFLGAASLALRVRSRTTRLPFCRWR